MSARDVLSPFMAWKNLFREPVTIRDPINDRPGAPRYRGFHRNDIDRCIGCGTCETICQNAAIDMVPVDSVETRAGDSGLRPRIDYGRCCWCALCVDICMTQSLTMSNHYQWVEADPDAFRFIPGVDPKPWDAEPLGYHRPAGHRLTAPERVEMAELAPAARADNFDEIVAGYTVEQAKAEADRCVACGLCVATCPTHMAIPDYIAAVRDGDYERGIELLYQSNPFSEVCGRVCTRRCEATCASRHEGDPIAIRWLKRHIVDQVPFERVREIVGDPLPSTGHSVAIIGAGPAGLTAAFDLARKGHQVTVFEAENTGGGMTRWGIPEYRLPYAAIDRDIALIESMGVEIVYNCRIGVDKSIDELHQQFEAVLLAIGLQRGRATRIPNSEHPQVYRAVDLLHRVTAGEAFDVPRQAVVIGGGNVAMDIARSLARLQRQRYGEVGMTLTALESIEHFLADPDEIKEAHEEGITIIDSQGPQSCELNAAGELTGLKTWQVVSIFDDQGRFAPTYDPQQETIHPADAVIEAIGQFADTELLGEQWTEALEWERGRIRIDAEGRTSLDWLWSAGDCVKGPDVVTAVADGHRVAASIERMLNKEEAGA